MENHRSLAFYPRYEAPRRNVILTTFPSSVWERENIRRMRYALIISRYEALLRNVMLIMLPDGIWQRVENSKRDESNIWDFRYATHTGQKIIALGHELFVQTINRYHAARDIFVFAFKHLPLQAF